MRINARIVSLFVLLALLADNACSIYDSTGMSADQLINESNGIYLPSGIPENPQEARAIWSRDSGVDFTKPGKQANNSTSANMVSSAEASDSIQFQKTSVSNSASAASVASTTGITGTNSASPAAATQKAAQTSPSDIAGEWTFELRDSKTRQLGLTLFQSEDAIYGDGTINDGASTLPVLASGSVHGDKLQMDVISSGTINLFRLTFTKSGGTVSGNYQAFSPGGKPWTGIANGMRTQG